MKDIKLGYEVGTGEEVFIPESHLIVTGVTQASGKTTTLEALIDRTSQKVIVFTTKPGEKSFQAHGLAASIRPFFRERCDWRYVEKLLEACMKERMKYERIWIIRICKGARTLDDVYSNILSKLKDAKVSKSSKDVYELLKEYFDLFLPELRAISFDYKLRPKKGINIMALETYRDEIQGLIINSVLEEILKKHKNVIVVLPEAWKFIPEKKANICKDSALALARQGATNGNYLWIDSQDMTNTDKAVLKQVTTWILGVQREINEVKRTLVQIPQSKPTVKDIMTLPKGHFYACMPDEVRKVYVQPTWVSDKNAKKISLGQAMVKDLKRPAYTPPSTPSPPQNNNPDVVDLRPELAKVQGDIVQINNELEVLKARRPEVDIDKVVSEVLSRMPKPSGDGTVYTVAPLEAINSQFLEEAKEKIIADVQDLDQTERKVLKFIEVQGKGISGSYVLKHCLHLTQGGTTSKKVSDIFRRLNSSSLVRYESRNGKCFPFLKERIKSMIGTFKATDQDIDQLYAHIMTELLR